MVFKLTARSGRAIFVDSSRVILAEEHAAGWLITVEALEPGRMPSGVWSGRFATSRILDLDQAGASPLIQFLDRCHGACGPP